MNTTSARPAAVADSDGGVRWPIAGLFLDALARRDFAALASCLDPEVRFRALVPPGPFELVGVGETMGRLRRWFDSEDDFEVVDASIGQVGTRLYLRWRVRISSASDPGSARLVEQHAFATAGELIETLDLLCSGFQAESAAPRCELPPRVAGSGDVSTGAKTRPARPRSAPTTGLEDSEKVAVRGGRGQRELPAHP